MKLDFLLKENEDEDWYGSRLSKYLIANPSILLTLLYLFSSSLGLINQYKSFSYYDLNILDYTEPSDFFLAAFKNPDTIILTVYVALAFILWRHLAKIVKKYIKNPIVRFFALWSVWPGLIRKQVLLPLALMTMYGYIFVMADKGLFFSEENLTKDATIELKGQTPNKISISVFGVTEKFIFGVKGAEHKDKKYSVIAIPISNISFIEYNEIPFDN